MKKVGTLVVALLLVCLLALPPVLGFVGQSQVEQRIEKINANNVLNIEVLDYRRGWFTSQASLAVALAPSYLNQLQALNTLDEPSFVSSVANRTITVQTNVTHGPLALADGVQLGFWHLNAVPDPAAVDNIELQQQLGMTQLFEFNGRAGFTGRLFFNLDIPAIDYDNGLASFGTADFALAGSYRGDRIVTDASLDSLYYGLGPIVFSLRGIRSKGDNEFWSQNIALGDFSVNVDALTVANAALPTEPTFEASGIAVVGNVEIDNGNLLSGAADYSFDSARTPGGIDLTDGLIRVTLDNLDAQAAQDYYAAASNMIDAPLDPGLTLDTILPIVQRLLAAEPKLSIAPIRFAVNGEAFDANINLVSNPGSLPAQPAIDLQDPSLWTSVVSVDARLSAAKPLAEMIAQQVVMMQLGAMPPDQLEQMAAAQAGLVLVTLTSQGMIVDEGDNYVASLEFSNGMLMLNGQPMPMGF